MNSINVSIIIPTCNRTNDLKLCLEKLVAQLSTQDDVEILVCDDGNGSTAKELVEEEFPSVTWIQGPRRGAACNRNAGARVASGEWLIFVDDDCLPRPNYLSSYREGMRLLGLGSRQVMVGATFNPEEKPSLLWEAPLNPEGIFFPSCNFSISKSLFWEFGGFDERFPHDFEDMEFFSRFSALGSKLHFVEGAAVDHPLRHVPPAHKLARRWESRVISSFDFGATPGQIMWLLPRHVLLVILSRFRDQKWVAENLKAIPLFAMEFLFFLQKLPSWIRRYHRSPRSSFWSDPIHSQHLPRRFGL